MKNGRIVSAVVNAPSAMHEPKISEWGGLSEELENTFNETGCSIVVDSDFDQSRYRY